MKMMKGILLLAAVALFAASQAYATPINPNVPSGEQSLQQILDGIAGTGAIDADTDQAHPSAYWRSGSVGSTSARIKFEYTGNADNISFGIFDPTNPANTLELFTGSNGPGTLATLGQFPGDASKYTLTRTVFNSDGTTTITNSSADFAVDNLFGFYLMTPNGTFYSDPSLNTDDNAQHLVAYQGGDLLGNEYIFGWEDSAFGSQYWDSDYNDFVVTVESIDPVPEPSALAMFGLGLLGLGLGLRMTRRRS